LTVIAKLRNLEEITLALINNEMPIAFNIEDSILFKKGVERGEKRGEKKGEERERKRSQINRKQSMIKLFEKGFDAKDIAYFLNCDLEEVNAVLTQN